jgi:hypothetical protein
MIAEIWIHVNRQKSRNINLFAARIPTRTLPLPKLTALDPKRAAIAIAGSPVATPGAIGLSLRARGGFGLRRGRSESGFWVLEMN